jgi:hypothetical protein
MLPHSFEHPVGSHYIVLHCRFGIYGTLTDIRIRGEMKKPVRSLNRILPVIVKQVTFHEPDPAGVNMSCNRLPATSAKGIYHEYFVTLCNKSINKV